MSKSNKKKAAQLGMSYGTACNRLRKSLMFRMAQQLGLDKCYRCGKPIESADELSVEHKKRWLDSEDPLGLFFDLDNVAFSHLSCNSGACRRRTAAHGTSTRYGPPGNCRCAGCKEAKSTEALAYRNRVKYRGTLEMDL